MIFDITPPIVSMPSESGVTSSSSISRLPVTRMSACTAAPSATTSSGLSSLCGARPKRSPTSRRTSGTRVEPPTRTTSSICGASRPASASAWRQGPSVRSTIGRISASNSGARDELAVRAAREDRRGFRRRRCSDSSHFASMTALRTACTASGPARRRDRRARRASSSRSMSSPPRCVSPLVASTWNTPSSTRRIEMSNVPPPKSYTAMMPVCRLSSP